MSSISFENTQMTKNERINTQLLKEEIKQFLLKNPETLMLLEQIPGKVPWIRYGDVWKYLFKRGLWKMPPDLKRYLMALWRLKKRGRLRNYSSLPKAIRSVLDDFGRATQKVGRITVVPPANAVALLVKGSFRAVVGTKKIWFSGPGIPFFQAKPRWGVMGVTQALAVIQNRIWEDYPNIPEAIKKWTKNAPWFIPTIEGTEWQAITPSQQIIAALQAGGATLFKLSGLKIKEYPAIGCVFGGIRWSSSEKWYKNVYIPRFGQDLRKHRCWIDSEDGQKYCGASLIGCLGKEWTRTKAAVTQNTRKRWEVLKTKAAEAVEGPIEHGAEALELAKTLPGELSKAARKAIIKHCRKTMAQVDNRAHTYTDAVIMKKIMKGKCLPKPGTRRSRIRPEVPRGPGPRQHRYED